MSPRIIPVLALLIGLSSQACHPKRGGVASKPSVAPTPAAPIAKAPACSEKNVQPCVDACVENNEVSACMTLGRAMVAQQNLGLAFTAMSRACDLGQACGCSYAGSAMLIGNGTKKAPAKAVPLLRKGCDGGCEAGCTMLGVAYAEGEGVDKDAGRAAAYYARGCELGSAHGCGLLGTSYFEGAGVRKDEDHGLSLLRRACEDDDEWSCTMAIALKQLQAITAPPSSTL